MDTYLNRLIIEFLAHGLVHLDEQVTYKYSQLTLDKIVKEGSLYNKWC